MNRLNSPVTRKKIFKLDPKTKPNAILYTRDTPKSLRKAKNKGTSRGTSGKSEEAETTSL